MPIVEAHILEGYDAPEKQRLCTALTRAVQSVVPAGPDAITVLLHEVAADSYMRGGQARKPAPALPDPADVVMRYLAAMEARDLTTAQSLLGDGFVMAFPGTAPMHELSELLDWARPRYRSVTKTFEAVETLHTDRAVVYTRGTLAGEWPDGSRFDGIRFVDRFELINGRIVRQDVWNDIAETRALQ